MWVAVSQSTRLCSISTFSQANPLRARNRAAVMDPRDNHVPTDGCPSRRARLTGLARIHFSRFVNDQRSLSSSWYLIWSVCFQPLIAKGIRLLVELLQIPICVPE